MANPALANTLNQIALGLSDHIDNLRKQQDSINAEIRVCLQEMEDLTSNLDMNDTNALKKVLAALTTKAARVEALRAQYNQLSDAIGQIHGVMVSLSNLAASLL